MTHTEIICPSSASDSERQDYLTITSAPQVFEMKFTFLLYMNCDRSWCIRKLIGRDLQLFLFNQLQFCSSLVVKIFLCVEIYAPVLYMQFFSTQNSHILQDQVCMKALKMRNGVFHGLQYQNHKQQ